MSISRNSPCHTHGLYDITAGKIYELVSPVRTGILELRYEALTRPDFEGPWWGGGGSHWNEKKDGVSG